MLGSLVRSGGRGMVAKSEPDYESQGIMARVSQALRQAGLTQTEVAKRAQEIHPKAARPMFHKALHNGARPRDPAVRDAFALALGVDAGWLWFGARPRRAGSPFMTRDLIVSEEEAFTDGPVAPAAAATAALAIKPDPAGYVLPVSHSLWEPMASRGDCIYISPSYPASSGDRVYVRGSQGEGIYRLVTLGEDAVTLVSPAGMQVSLPRSGVDIHRIAGIIFS